MNGICVIVTKRSKQTKTEPPTSVHDAFMEHKNVLIAYMAKYFLSREDVEDVLQDTYLNTMEAEQEKSIKSPRSYLFIVARNLIFKRLRSQSKQLNVEISDIDPSYLISPEVPADQSLHDRDRLRVLLEAASSLPPQCRRVFLMRKIKGMSQKEIADELNISPSTVERHITNAISRCDEFMNKKGYDKYDGRKAPTVRVAKAASDE